MRCMMRDKRIIGLFLGLLCCLLLSGCGKKMARQAVTQSPNPNASITYEKGRDLVGVLTKAEAGSMTFYEPELEKEATYTYSGATEILTKNEKQISSESLEIGQVLDLYLDEGKTSLQKVQISKDIVENDDVKDVRFYTDESYLEIQGTRYRYGSGFQAFSDGKPIELQEIAATDEVTFRGVKGKAYSIVVTKGHGYIKPAKYKDFIGGTMTISGVRILPVTKDMLVPVPEGRNLRSFHEKRGL